MYETVLTGTGEMLAEGRVDLAIGTREAGVTGKELMALRFVPVAHPEHPLHRLGRALTDRDLRRHRRILIRDTSTQRRREVAGVEMRWTVSHKATSIRAVAMGLGFAWLPEDTICDELRDGSLKRLHLREGSERMAPILLAFSDPEFPGRDTARLAQIIEEGVKRECARSGTRRRSAPAATTLPKGSRQSAARRRLAPRSS